MLTQTQADELIRTLKDAVRQDALTWEAGQPQDEELKSVEIEGVRFVLSLNRNPFEVRLHLRTKRDCIGLMRIDAARYHQNPDDTELRDRPHLHVYREGAGLAYAEAIDWYDVTDPFGTLERFLTEAHARFPCGIQRALF